MSRNLQIAFPQRDVGGLPSPKAHHVSLIPVLYTVGGWGCWTAIANFFHLAGGRGWKKIHLFAFLFSTIIIRTVECFTHCHGNPHTTVYQETYSGTKECNWWVLMEPTSFM